MSKINKYIIFWIITAGLLFPTQAQSDDKTLITYYPALYGEYERIRFLPRVGQADLVADAAHPCVIGTVYSTATAVLKYCFNDGSGKGLWGNVPDVWLQNIDNAHSLDNIYLTDTAANSNLRVGIGTSTPEFKLTIKDNPTILAKGTLGSGANLPAGLSGDSRLIWYPRKGAFRAGQVTGSQWDNASIGTSSVAMGKNTTASASYSTIGGGENNSATNSYATVIGGFNNLASGYSAAIGGGRDNTASGNYAMIYGGQSNQATNTVTTIIGGKSNQATGIGATVGGGDSNIASVNYSFIGGGRQNLIDRLDDGTSPIGYAVIGGGEGNNARHDYNVVGGGENNRTRASFATIIGGRQNSIGNLLGLVGKYSTITGGDNNTILHDYSTISGGYGNITNNIYNVIGGGLQNKTSGDFAIASGGENNTASGLYSVIMGGTDNVAAGDYSWVGGRRVQLTADADRTFAWGYSDDGNLPVVITASDSFIIAPGRILGADWNPKVGIRTTKPSAVLEINANNTTDNYLSIYNNNNNILTIKNNGTSSLVYIGVGNNRESPTDSSYIMQFRNANDASLTVDGNWRSTSSRKYKENIRPLTSIDAEKALDNLNPVTFNYRATPDRKNVGFIAEDVPDLVAMNGRTMLSTLEIVALLTQTVKDQEEQIKKQNQRIEKIQDRIDHLKNILGGQ